VDAALATARAAYAVGDYGAALAAAGPAAAAAPGRPDAALLAGAACYSLGRYDACVAWSDAALAAAPGAPEAHATLADGLRGLGRLDLAVLCYASALRLRPTFPGALANLASALAAGGAAGPAAQCASAAAALGPAEPEVAAHLGDLLAGLGRPADAADAYRRALASAPGHPRALRGLGGAAAAAGDAAGAAAAYAAAAAAAPDDAAARTGLAAALRALGRHTEADAAAAEAAALCCSPLPPALAAAGGLGVAAFFGHHPAGLHPAVHAGWGAPPAAMMAPPPPPPQWPPAVAVAAPPPGASPPPHAAAAAAAAAAAQAAAAQAAAGASQLAAAYTNMGGALRSLGRSAEAAACYAHAAALQPAWPEAHANLGAALKDGGRHDEAAAAYRAALALRPGWGDALAQLVHTLQCVCEWGPEREALDAALVAAVRADLAAGRTPPVQPFHAMSYAWPADLVVGLASAYARAAAAAAVALPPPFPDVALPHPPRAPLPPTTRLRVAFVSSDLNNHPLAHLMASVPGLLRSGGVIEAFWYATSPPDGSPWRARFEVEGEHFVDASAWPARAVAASIARDARAHVAVDLNGYTKGARTEVFALRPAPVQAAYMGFPDTLGARAFIPWLITDALASPAACEAWYGEALARLPRCYFVNDYAAASPELLVGDWTDGGAGKGGIPPPPSHLPPPVATAAAALPRPTRSALGLPPRPACVFASPNQLYKIDPPTLSAWARILARVPGSVLWLLHFPPAGEARLQAALAASGTGVDPARLVFTDVAPKADHLRRCGLADVILDTPLVNAHTTACDVLWAGVPLVTLPGARMASRVGASLAAATGCGAEMIASSWADYEDKAVALGLDTGGCRARLAARLRAARLTCTLFDTAGWVRDFERLLGRLWGEHARGAEPASFELEAAGK